MHVLLVDDDPLTRQAVRHGLEHAGFHVTTAPEGKAALELLAAHRFDAIVCDIRMPDMDGTQFYRRLEMGMPEMARRVLFLTGVAGETPVTRFLMHTPQPILEKPQDAPALAQAVVRLVSRQGPVQPAG